MSLKRPELVLLDLDETLLPTSVLLEVRHSGAPQRLSAVIGYPAIVLHDGIHAAVELLCSSVLVGIVSSSPRWYVEQILADHLHDIDFCVVVTYDDVTHLKPHPEPLLEALRLAGGTVDEAAYVGDALVDHDACSAIGMPFFAAGWAGGATFPDSVRVLASPAELDLIVRGARG